MTSKAAPHMTDALLHEAPWVRRLAFSLAANPHDAADLEQDIWHAALSLGGEAPRSIRGWLTGTARRLAAFRARTAARARAREAAAAAPEAVQGDAAMLAARQELHRKLLDAVDRLPDAMRQVVLLRHFEELAPREIAARLGVSVNTIQTRLQRGRQRLRADLDRDYDRRAAWTALALVDWREGAVGATAGTGVATPFAAILLMSTSKPVLVGATALVLAISTWFAISGPQAATATRGQASLPQRPVALDAGPPEVPSAAPPADQRSRTPVADGAGPGPVHPRAGTGRVVDMAGNPIERVEVRFARYTKGLDGAEWPSAQTRITDEDGLFELPAPPMGRLLAVHPDYVSDEQTSVVVTDGPTILRMRRTFTVPLEVTLTDTASGEPVPRFTVSARSFWHGADDRGEEGPARFFAAPEGAAGEEGSCATRARFVAGAEHWFVAVECAGMAPPRSDGPGYQAALQEARSALRRHLQPVPGEPIRLHFSIDLGRWEREAPAGVLGGLVVDGASRAPIAGVAVSVREDGAAEPLRTVQTDARGSFTIVRPGPDDAGQLTFRHPDYASTTVAGSALGTEAVMLQPRGHFTVEVVAADGVPSPGQTCLVIHADAPPRTAPDPAFTDRNGRLRCEGVEPGRYLVLVIDGVQGNDDRPLATASFTIAPGEDATHRIRIGGAGATVSGVVLQPNGEPMDDSRGEVSVFLLSHAAAGPMVRSERSKDPATWLARNVPPGDYLAMIQVGRGDEIIAWFPRVEIGAMAATTVDLQIPAGAIAGRIIGVERPETLRVLALPDLPAGSTAAGMLANPEARRALASAVAPDGTFAIARTADGAWTLEVLAGADDGAQRSRAARVIATRKVTVRGGAELGDWTVAK